MRKADIRDIRLLEELKTHGQLDVQTVVGTLDISEATARRMFARLEKDGKLIRTHGGVRTTPQIEMDYSYRVSSTHRLEQKRLIGEAAAELVENRDRVFLDSGTTVLRFAEALTLRIKTGAIRDVVVLTNSISYLDTLATCCKVILIGGEIRPDRRDVCGATAEVNLTRYHVNKAFMGADAIDRSSGFMTTDERTARMNEIVLERADKAFILADSEKFERRSFISYAGFDVIDAVLTDGEMNDRLMRLYKKAGARVRKIGRTDARK